MDATRTEFVKKPQTIEELDSVPKLEPETWIVVPPLVGPDEGNMEEMNTSSMKVKVRAMALVPSISYDMPPDTRFKVNFAIWPKFSPREGVSQVAVVESTMVATEDSVCVSEANSQA